MRKWDKKTLNELKDYYSLMYERSSNDPFRQNEYYNTISSLNYIASLNTGLHIALPSKVKYVDVVNSDLGILSTYGHYCPILRTMQPYYDNYYIGNSNLKNVKSDPKKLLQVTDDFYEDFYDTITLSYREIRKWFDTNMMFFNISKDKICSGETYGVYGTGISFYSIGIANTIQDYISVIHEAAHGINNNVNPNIMYDQEKYCFIEADALFMELIGADFVANSLNAKKEIFKLELDTLKDYLYSCDVICTKMDMYNELSKNDKYNKKEAISFLKNGLGCDKQYIKDVTETYISELFHYIISYLTAIELYQLYKTDPDAAIIHYIQIRDVKGLSNVEYLEYVRSLGINPGENLEAYISSLLKIDKEKKLIYEKKI